MPIRSFRLDAFEFSRRPKVGWKIFHFSNHTAHLIRCLCSFAGASLRAADESWNNKSIVWTGQRLESPSTWKFALAYYNLYLSDVCTMARKRVSSEFNHRRNLLGTKTTYLAYGSQYCNRNSNMHEEHMENHYSNFRALKEKAFEVNWAFPLTFMRNVKVNSVEWHGNFADWTRNWRGHQMSQCTACCTENTNTNE